MSRADILAKVTDVLEGHETWFNDHYVLWCKCKTSLGSGAYKIDPKGDKDRHHAHLAAVLTDALTDELAAAWDEGVDYMAERCVDDHDISASYQLSANPYRTEA